MIAAAAVAAAVVAPLVIANPFANKRDQSVWAAEALAVAEAVPRYLVTANGWEVTRADEFSVDRGEMSFEAPDGAWLDLFWATGVHGSYATWVEEWSRDYQPRGDAPVDGATALLVGDDYVVEDSGEEVSKFVAIWESGGYVLRAESEAFDEVDDFLAVVGAVRQVGVDEWLGAMPASIVQPHSRAAAVEEMLADIPVPEGFDAAHLAEGDGVVDRYQLGAQVTSAVLCEWSALWLDATEVGDQAGAREAAEAMAGAPGWTIVIEMEASGDWGEGLVEYADAMATGDPDGVIDELLHGENDTCGPT